MKESGRARWSRACLFGGIAVALFARPAAAFDRRTERAARDALARAEQEFNMSDFDVALGLLERALRQCGSTKCTATTKGELWRDLGTIQVKNGEKDDALTSFVSALRFDPALELNPAYDVPDSRSYWAAAKDQASIVGAQQPTGDFVHSPAPEQVVRTPLPVYVEYAGSTAVPQVVVKYKGAGMSAYKRVTLARKGNGWGGLIPCADVALGIMRYYVQGFDAGGEPVLNSGDPKHPFVVPIRSKISTEPPNLPGEPKPVQCTVSGARPPSGGGEETPERPPKKEDGEACSEDTECTSGACAKGKCGGGVAGEGGRPFARIWFGVAGSLDFTSMPSADDVCKRDDTSGNPINTAGYTCTDPNDGDFPANKGVNDTLAPGNAGHADGGIHAANVRLVATFDYALSQHLLLGARAGYVFSTYTGETGKTFGPPLHLEARATYVFGTNPLAHSGFAPFAFGALGVGPYDVYETVFVTQTGAAGQRPVLAWRNSGPFFIAAGGGARYAFSARAAFLMGLKLTTAFGGSGLFPAFGPELGVQLGF
jgi:hypothetical protein